MVMIGFVMVMMDSYLLVPNEQPHYVWDVINPFYLDRQPYIRVLADIVPPTNSLDCLHRVVCHEQLQPLQR